MIADDDPTAQRLREAVWADPTADAPRMVFADYFLQAGDPLGELVALQLDRARTGDPISERERALTVAHGRRNFQPIDVGGVQRFTLDRGFLSHALPLGTMMTDEVAHHPAWSTLQSLTLLAGATHPLFGNPHLKALATLRTTDECLLQLSERTEALPITVLTSPVPHRGIALNVDKVPALSHRGAFDRVRTLSLAAWQFERALNSEHPVLDSKLIQQLGQLDLTFTSVRTDDLRMWKNWFQTTTLERFSVQVPLAQNDRPPGVVEGQQFATKPTRFITVVIARDTDTVSVQLDEPTESNHVDDALQVVDQIARDRTVVEISDVADSNRLASRHPALLERLREAFTEVRVATGPVRTIAP